MASLIVAGFSLAASLMFFVLLAIIIFFGMMGELAGAVVVAALISFLHGEISRILSVWVSNPKIYKTMEFFVGIGFLKSVAVLFFFAAAVSFVTRSIKIFHVSNNTQIGR